MTAGRDVPWRRLTVCLRSVDHAGHHSLATELLDRARRAHLAGATLLEGSGRPAPDAHHPRHPHHLLRREETPLSLLLVDRADKLERFIEDNAALLGDRVVLLDDVTAFRA